MVMQFKFDGNHEYQLGAIESVARLLEGQPRVEPTLELALGAGFAAVANRLDLGADVLMENLQTVQAENNLPPDGALETIEAEIESVDGRKAVRFPNFSVEMETGTGKTYVTTGLPAYPLRGVPPGSGQADRGGWDRARGRRQPALREAGWDQGGETNHLGPARRPQAAEGWLRQRAGRDGPGR